MNKDRAKGEFFNPRSGAITPVVCGATSISVVLRVMVGVILHVGISQW